jgi:hypothetical protein
MFVDEVSKSSADLRPAVSDLASEVQSSTGCGNETFPIKFTQYTLTKFYLGKLLIESVIA